MEGCLWLQVLDNVCCEVFDQDCVGAIAIWVCKVLRDAHSCVPAQEVTDWPACGGANGSIRFDPELGYGCNAGASWMFVTGPLSSSHTLLLRPTGLNGATGLLEPLKAKYPDVTYADLYQMASALSIEVRRAGHFVKAPPSHVHNLTAQQHTAGRWPQDSHALWSCGCTRTCR